ncbi:MAG: PAS domain S-box protein, partial [Carboxylicivirga sp.]|nr:PAS domain S-box protein [Carboxylicivirga sp.]
KGNVVDVNKGYLAITGYSYKEFVGINYSHYTHPDDLEKEAELLQDIRQGKRDSYRLEKRIKSKQGDYVWLDLSVTSIRNNKKQLESFIVLVIDVTERRKAAESLKVFFNQPMNIHLIAGVDGQIIRVNSGWKTILGYSRSEIEGTSFLDLVHPDDIEPTINEMKALDEGKTTLYFENRYRHKDGQYIWLAWSAIANTSSHQIHAIAKDITEEKLYHEALVKSEENYKALSENARHLIITHRFNGEISYANKYAVEFLQVKKEKLIGADIKRFISDENETKKIESEADKGGKLKVQHSEVVLTLPSGDRKVLDVLKSPIKIQRKIDSILITAYDISERKEAERKIKEQNEQYEALNEELKQSNEDLFKANQKHEEINERFDLALEATKDGLWDWNLLTNDLYLSPNWKKMIGYRDDELPNDFTVWEKLTKLEDAKSVLAKLDDLLQRKINRYDVEFKMRHKEGHWVDIHSRADIFFNEEGKAYRIVGTHSDITEKKRAENKIRESEEKLRLAIDNSPLGICTSDLNGNFITSNKAYESIVGYAKEELIDLTIFDITHPDYLPENKSLFDAMVTNSNKGFHLEKKYIRKDGVIVDVRVNTGIIFDELKKPLFAMALIEDITEQKHLESRNRMLFKAIESSPVSVVITNAKGNIEYVNSFFSQMTGYTKIEAVGKNPRILKSGHHSKTYYEEMWEKLCHGESWAGEFLNKKKNGELYWENAIISPILNKDGKISQYIAIKEDITEQKKTLSELQLAKDKAEEANALKVEFLHNLSHEIRTPMNGIIGFAELLEELEETDDLQKNYISIIKNSSTQLLRVIDDILEISTLETKQLTVRKRAFDVNHFIMELFAIYDLKAKERKLSLFIKKGLENDNSQIVSDKVKINKVLSNLIDNAFKFTQEGQIEFGYTIDESNIVFFVKDTGIGITPEKQAKIFERFSQESTTTAQIYGGLGLGLSIAKENTELLGGYLTVESSKGKGATFYAHIPFTKHEEVDEQEVNKALPIKDKNDVVNILIAEDEEVNYLYLETVLDAIEEYKTKFHHAKNGKEAVKIALENDSIKLVLMDIKMPIMNGYTATQEIKAVKPELPIIAQTAYSTSLERDQALKHGCDDFISKPIKKEELILKVNKFLNQLSEN